MKADSVLNHTFILRCQAEYSTVAQAVVLRCILAMPATGQQCGFTDLDTLLRILRAELVDLQAKIVPPEEAGKNI